jgi:3-hydroxymyristoyl/3-hydroxydecanoyl-(acyl carrier protein) dehydratase
MMPHAYPFRLLERGPGDDGALPLRWTVNGALDRGLGAMPPVLAVEMLAQAALVLLGGAGDAGGGGGGLLAGVEEVAFHAPLRAGDRLEAHATVTGRFGRLVKARAWIARGGDTVVEGELLLALS